MQPLPTTLHLSGADGADQAGIQTAGQECANGHIGYHLPLDGIGDQIAHLLHSFSECRHRRSPDRRDGSRQPKLSSCTPPVGFSISDHSQTAIYKIVKTGYTFTIPIINQSPVFYLMFSVDKFIK